MSKMNQHYKWSASVKNFLQKKIIMGFNSIATVVWENGGGDYFDDEFGIRWIWVEFECLIYDFLGLKMKMDECVWWLWWGWRRRNVRKYYLLVIHSMI